jgi:hypothetical protein
MKSTVAQAEKNDNPDGLFSTAAVNGSAWLRVKILLVESRFQ